MYSYTWDKETGGLLLNNSPLQFSKEPRPVYSQELDLLGFDKLGWIYDRDDSAPLMWAEANNYIYRGRTVAKTVGGAIYSPPELKILEEPESLVFFEDEESLELDLEPVSLPDEESLEPWLEPESESETEACDESDADASATSSVVTSSG